MSAVKFGLFGAGGFAREVLPYVESAISVQLDIAVDEIEIFLVETWEPEVREINGCPVISEEDFCSLDGDRYFNVAIADPRVRSDIVKRITGVATPLAIRSTTSLNLYGNDIGEGAILCPYTTITANARIGRFFHANIYSYVAHDCVIGDYVTFAPAVRCNGHVTVEDFAYIGTGALLRQGTWGKPLRIGIGATVGMGAVVTRDVPDGVTVAGNPARILGG